VSWVIKLDSNSFTKTKNWSGRNEVTETSGRLHPLWPQNKWLHTPQTTDYRHTRQDRWIQTELAFTLSKNATKPSPFEIIPLQTTRKENNWKTKEALARAAVTLEMERIKGSNPWCFLWWWWCDPWGLHSYFVEDSVLRDVTLCPGLVYANILKDWHAFICQHLEGLTHLHLPTSWRTDIPSSANILKDWHAFICWHLEGLTFLHLPTSWRTNMPSSANILKDWHTFIFKDIELQEEWISHFYWGLLSYKLH